MFADLHYPFLLLMKTNVVAKCVIYELLFIYVDQALRCLQNKSPTFTLGSVGPYDIQVNSLNTLMRDNQVSDEVNYYPYSEPCKFLHLFSVTYFLSTYPTTKTSHHGLLVEFSL